MDEQLRAEAEGIQHRLDEVTRWLDDIERRLVAQDEQLAEAIAFHTWALRLAKANLRRWQRMGLEPPTI